MREMLKVILVDNKDRKVEVQENVWPLAEDLFLGWGYEQVAINIAKTKNANLKVRDIEDITPELSAWGIPWKRI